MNADAANLHHMRWATHEDGQSDSVGVGRDQRTDLQRACAHRRLVVPVHVERIVGVRDLYKDSDGRSRSVRSGRVGEQLLGRFDGALSGQVSMDVNAGSAQRWMEPQSWRLAVWMGHARTMARR